jgi:hypothetical protein
MKDSNKREASTAQASTRIIIISRSLPLVAELQPSGDSAWADKIYDAMCFVRHIYERNSDIS